MIIQLCFEIQQKFNEAEKLCDQAFTRDKTNLIVLCRKDENQLCKISQSIMRTINSNILISKQGKYEECKKYLKQVLDEKKNIFQQITIWEMFYQQIIKKRRLFLIMISVSKERISQFYFYYLGISLISLRRMDEARNIFEKALLVNNNYSSSHFHFALSLEDFKQFDSAIFHYNQAIKINPSFYQAYENRGNQIEYILSFFLNSNINKIY